jgi:heme/copper-type cytochrome/quinol oxidase subunit 2
MKPQILLGLISASTGLIYVPAIANACAVCWAGDGGPIEEAFNWSVLFLMATPYAVVGSIAGWLFYAHRRSAAKRERNEATQPLSHLALNPEESGR